MLQVGLLQEISPSLDDEAGFVKAILIDLCIDAALTGRWGTCSNNTVLQKYIIHARLKCLPRYNSHDCFCIYFFAL